MMQTKVTRMWVAAAALIAFAGAAARADFFDWRNRNGNDYTTPVRNQGACGSCWAFGAIGAAESRLEIVTDNPGLNPDLSEQHLVYDSWGGGDCDGGFMSTAFHFLRWHGAVTEAELPYEADDDPADDDDWPLAAGWENRVYKIENPVGIDDYDGDTVFDEIVDDYQAGLMDYGPLGFTVRSGTILYRELPTNPSPSTYTLGDAHCMLLTGFQDDSGVSGGGYWIVKNSWGSFGDNGYVYLPYSTEFSSIMGVAGDVFQVPEPATIGLLCLGMMAGARRRGRTATTSIMNYAG